MLLILTPKEVEISIQKKENTPVAFGAKALSIMSLYAMESLID